MKSKRYLLIGLVFGMAIGWSLGILRLPYIENNISFLRGFIAALAFVSLALMLLAVWNSNLFRLQIRKTNVAGDDKNSGVYGSIWIVLAGTLLLGSIVSGLTVYRQGESFKLQVQTRDKKIQGMAALVQSLKKNDLKPLMNSILFDVGEELKRHPGRTLLDTTIARIAALSIAIKPHHYIVDGSLSEIEYSPERGQLLRALMLLNIDSGSFARIKLNVPFSGADFRGIDLKGLDLSGINLRGANLSNADLSSGNLKGADLGEANLWAANLNQTNLSNTDLKKADLSWAQLNNANLTLANLNGAKLTNAQLRKADLYDAIFQCAEASGALFNEANLTSADLVGTNLTKANLNQANLSYTDLRFVVFSEADLTGATLNKASVDKNWHEKLKSWRPFGEKNLLKNYTFVNDTFTKFKVPIYRLIKN